MAIAADIFSAIVAVLALKKPKAIALLPLLLGTYCSQSATSAIVAIDAGLPLAALRAAFAARRY